MNIIDKSISILTSLWPQSQGEALFAVGVGMGLTATSGALVAGITVTAGIALKRKLQHIARQYIASLPPTRKEIAKIYRELNDLRRDIGLTIIDIRSFRRGNPDWISVCTRVNKMENKKLSPHQKEALHRLKVFVTQMPDLFSEFQEYSQEDQEKWSVEARNALIEDCERSISDAQFT